MTKCASRAVPCVIFLLLLVPFASGQSPAPATPQVVAPAAALYSNPVLAGDYPDPSIIRVGEDYWATATSSEWAPIFPLLHSRDLVNWNVVGAVFEKRPE
ncbi:MAG TPA: family 43 glycosylhydrolase, partial [Clostridia bacterium]|nr:family 43 glycosylhydrolase [Clostridia bacterium]